MHLLRQLFGLRLEAVAPLPHESWLGWPVGWRRPGEQVVQQQRLGELERRLAGWENQSSPARCLEGSLRLWVVLELEGGALLFGQVVRRGYIESWVVEKEGWAGKHVKRVRRGPEELRQNLLEVVYVRPLPRPVEGFWVFGVWSEFVHWMVGKEHGPVVDAVVRHYASHRKGHVWL